MLRSFKGVTKLASKKSSLEKQELENDWKAKSKPLDVVLLLDTRGDEYNHNYLKHLKTDPTAYGAITLSFYISIKQKTPFIVSAHLLYILKNSKNPTYIDAFKQLTTNDWLVYEDTTKSFCIAFPKDYIADIPFLSYVGINDKQVKRIPPSALNSYAQKSLPLISFSINISHLKALFINPYARKRIFLNGHGLYSSELLSSFVKKTAHLSSYFFNKAIIASLSSEQYLDFLTFLNSQGTDFVYVRSCYAGGYSLLLYQKLDELITKAPLSYFLTIGVSTDTETSSGTFKDRTNFQDFFKNINNFFEPTSKDTVSLETIVGSLSSAKLLTNIPSVRFPGRINYFKALNINNETEIITYAKAVAHTLKMEPATKSHQPALIKKEIQPFDIHNKTAILVYPLYVAAPLHISGTLPSTIISMIPGHAFHMFTEIKAEIMHQLTELFLNIESISEKVFFIEKFEVADYTNSGLPSGILEKVMIAKKPKSQQPRSIIIAQVEGVFYQAEHGTDFQPIDADQAKEIISKTLNNIKDKTLQRAVNQATNGRENIEDIYKKAVKIFVPKSPEEQEALLKKKQEKHERSLAEKEQALQQKRERIERNKSQAWIGY